MSPSSEPRAERAGRLSLEDDIGRRLRARREERNPKEVKASVIVDSVTEGKNQKDESKPSLEDPNSDIVDRMTGK